MTKGELISACIKLMFDADTEQIDPATVSNNPDYLDRTITIIEAINRALHRIEAKNKLPKKTFIIDKDTTFIKETPMYKIYNLNELISDILIYDRISFHDEQNCILNSNISFQTMGFNQLMLEKLIEEQYYIIYYRPKCVELKYNDLDTMILPYDDYILSAVPYGVKADLYEEENPNVALTNRDIFENFIAQIPSQEDDQNRKIVSYYDY